MRGPGEHVENDTAGTLPSGPDAVFHERRRELSRQLRDRRRMHIRIQRRSVERRPCVSKIAANDRVLEPRREPPPGTAPHEQRADVPVQHACALIPQIRLLGRMQSAGQRQQYGMDQTRGGPLEPAHGGGKGGVRGVGGALAGFVECHAATFFLLSYAY